MIPKRLSITHSPELCRRLKENPPTIGMLTAFGFGASLWIEICEGDLFGLTPVTSLLKGYLSEFKRCRRITMFHRIDTSSVYSSPVLLVKGYLYDGPAVPCSFKYEVSFSGDTGKVLTETFKDFSQ